MTVCGGFLDNAPAGLRAVILVEGSSDQIAIETLAARLGCNLASEGVAVAPMGGVHAIDRFLTCFGPQGANLQVGGLYDVGEEGVVRRGLQRSGLGSDHPFTHAAMEELGFYACMADLEEELIRALGVAAVEAIIAAQDELHSFRTLQKQPAWRGHSSESQIRRFFGSGARRKPQYARLLVDALDLASVPRPFHRVLTQIR